MNTLTQSDLNFVLSRTPKDIVALMKKNPGALFVAGGFIRSTIAGETVSDIDLFGVTKDQLKSIAKDLCLDRKARMFETKNAITVLSPPRHPVQFITRWLFETPDELIRSFDFTVCQAVIWAEKHNDAVVFRSMISDMFYVDLAARRLNYTRPKRVEEAGGSLLRAIKFVKKGYSIQTPSLAGLVARVCTSVDWDRINSTHEGDMSPEERVSFVITGLLRQVDPLTVVDGVDFVDEHEVQ